MNIEVDLHDFSDDEIETYARDHLDLTLPELKQQGF